MSCPTQKMVNYAKDIAKVCDEPLNEFMLKDFEATGSYIARNKHHLTRKNKFIPRYNGGRNMKQKHILKRLFPLRMIVVWVGIVGLMYFSEWDSGVVFAFGVIGALYNWFTFKLESASIGRVIDGTNLQADGEQSLFKNNPVSLDLESEFSFRSSSDN